MQVTLFTKSACSLCEDVEDVVLAVRDRVAFQLEVRNILEDPDAYELYKHDIPVVLLDGREIARHRMTEEQFESALGSKVA